jgi:hypothetical protein
MDHKKKQPEKKVLFNLDSKTIRNYLIAGIVLLVGYSFNKKLFLMAIFIVVTTIGKVVRQQVGNSMIMFDPLVFFSILIMKFWGFTYLLIFLFITVFIADAIAGHLTIGTFLNYALFHICPLFAFLILGKLPLIVYGTVTAIIYSIAYAFLRTQVLPDDPIAVYSKAITNVIFVFLYITFLGPIFQLIM